MSKTPGSLPFRPLYTPEYVSEQKEESELTEAARQRFREAIREIYPHCLRSLQKEVFPAFVELVNRSSDPRLLTSGVFTGLRDRRFDGIRESFLSWAQTFHVASENWFLDDLLRTLRNWHLYPTLRDALVIDSGSFGSFIPISDAEQRFEFLDSGWQPTIERWDRFSIRLTTAFRAELKQYEQRVRSMVESRGFEKAVRRRSDAQFSWLVLWQLAGWPQGKIADWHNRQTGKVFDETRIRLGVEDAARLMGLRACDQDTVGHPENRNLRNLPSFLFRIHHQS